MTEAPAFIESFAVVLCVKEKLSLPYYSIRAAKTAQKVVYMHHLVNSIGWACLLAVAECRIAYQYVPVFNSSEVKFHCFAVYIFNHWSFKAYQWAQP